MRLVHWTSQREAEAIMREGFKPLQGEAKLPMWERMVSTQTNLGFSDGVSFGIPGLEEGWKKMVGEAKREYSIFLGPLLSYPAPLAGIEIEVDIGRVEVCLSTPTVTRRSNLFGPLPDLRLSRAVEVVIGRTQVNTILEKGGGKLVLESTPVSPEEKRAVKRLAAKRFWRSLWPNLKRAWSLRPYLTMAVRAKQVEKQIEFLRGVDERALKIVRRINTLLVWILGKEVEKWKKLDEGLDKVSLAKHEEYLKSFEEFLTLMGPQSPGKE